ncbi:hypothetical protein HMPREF1148_0634, partial [Selenomonas sp. FOBRC6]
NYGVDGLSGFIVTDAALAADLVHFGYETDIANCGKMADVLPQSDCFYFKDRCTDAGIIHSAAN